MEEITPLANGFVSLASPDGDGGESVKKANSWVPIRRAIRRRPGENN